MPTIELPVSGMTCAACSGRVQRALERSPGVSSANVNLMTGAATVEFDPETTSPERLVETIRGTGYGADLPAAGAAEDLLGAQDRARMEEERELRRKLAVSLAAALLAIPIGMPLAGMTESGATMDPLMRFMAPLNDAPSVMIEIKSTPEAPSARSALRVSWPAPA